MVVLSRAVARVVSFGRGKGQGARVVSVPNRRSRAQAPFCEVAFLAEARTKGARVVPCVRGG